MPLITYSAALQVIALIYTCEPGYVTQGWHGALITIGFQIFAILFNMFAMNNMPLVEGIVVIIHLFGFIAFIVIFWVGNFHRYRNGR
jgi:choline transport protein